jgi:hypothetical protein
VFHFLKNLKLDHFKENTGKKTMNILLCRNDNIFISLCSLSFDACHMGTVSPQNRLDYSTWDKEKRDIA